MPTVSPAAPRVFRPNRATFPIPMATTAPPPLIDSHCHLTWPSLVDDVPALVARMDEQNVVQAVVVATSVEDALATHALCARYDALFPTAGIHPCDVPKGLDEALGQLGELVATGDYVAVGETGLDYFRDESAVECQRKSFQAQCELARDSDLPVIVHIRDKPARERAFQDVADIIGSVQGLRGVIHCYTGEASFAETYQELGMHVSFSGILTFPKGENVRRAADVVDASRLLVETDSPFLAPVPRRGKRNEPAYVRHTARALAERKSMSESDLALVTTSNARDLFGLPTSTPVGSEN